ncbi:DNA gyrase inhibitor YacG [Cognatishimia sp. F0-27]|uniref:DNA gyrase inhibitor YacG n=1 Tax=Cognatishimia sp. F0-27 TaxID=2816855 RepID=UPI001D0C89E7|nr:DNA gyrase inhibitor YacG [Cognatishimia sp. F0-27]MCC1495007.1 DNA gyrase inhibitor YacG [Cognatishimia sp. F0-27]
MGCPICERDSDQKYRPFCSRRCADIDLAKWMTGSYAIPSDDPQDAEEALEASIHALEQASKEGKPH